MFAGTVLPPTGTNLIADDHNRSFHVRDDEKPALVAELVGKPVRFEHEPALTAGKIKSARVQKDGSVAVIGTLDDNTLTANYLQQCMGQSCQYTGLSLCHEWLCDRQRARDRKRPLEVSVCRQPKRPGCFVEFYCNDNYKRPMSNQVHMASNTPTDSNATAATENAPGNTDAKQEAPAESDANQQSAEIQAMEMALKIKDEYERQKQKAEELQKELDSVHAERKAKEAKEAALLKQQSDALAEALQKSWARWAPESSSYESAKALMDNVRETDPKLGHELLQLIECASSRVIRAQDDLKKQQQDASHEKLKQQYTAQVAGLLDTAGVVPANSAPAPPTPQANPQSAPAPASPRPNPYVTGIAPSANKSTRPAPFVQQAEHIKAAFQRMSSGGMLNTMQRVVEAASGKDKDQRDQKRARFY